MSDFNINQVTKIEYTSGEFQICRRLDQIIELLTPDIKDEPEQTASSDLVISVIEKAAQRRFLDYIIHRPDVYIGQSHQNEWLAKIEEGI